MRKFTILLGLTTAALSLSACTSPTYMPSGYSYHRDLYKSPPADNPWPIGYEYTEQKNAAILGAWRSTATDVVDKLESTADLGAQPVFLSSPTLDNAFTLSLDHALRDELRSRGYTLAGIPGDDSLKLKATTYDPEFKDALHSFVLNEEKLEGDPEPPKAIQKELVIKITGLVDGAPTTLIEAPYELPLYGYQDRQRYFPLAQYFAETWR